MIIRRSIQEQIREGLSWEERWRGEDKGLIVCWEVGRAKRRTDETLASKCERGELPVLGWTGGVDKMLKKPHKYGALMYLAQWQGLCGSDLCIDTSKEVSKTCCNTGMKVTFTDDSSKYAFD